MVLVAASVIGVLALRTPPAHKQRRVANVHGNFFVDESCIDCDTCRWMAPATFGRAGAKSFVFAQPEDETDEKMAALAAAVACPTGSIRTVRPDKEMRKVLDAFPIAIDAARLPCVFHLGYHCAASFGATPYLLASPHGNVMIDCPRFNSRLARQIDALGGVQLLLLTHMDDVGEMARWKERYPAMQRCMHARDVRGPDQWPYIDMRGVERQLEGEGPWLLPLPGGGDGDGGEGGGDAGGGGGDGLTAIYTPGHSAGSLSFLAEAGLVRARLAVGWRLLADHRFTPRLALLEILLPLLLPLLPLLLLPPPLLPLLLPLPPLLPLRAHRQQPA